MGEELILKDRGNIRPDTDELVSQELLSYLDSTNKELGTELDPRFDEFNRFINSIEETAILRIEPESMSTGKFNDLDLSGGDESLDEIKDVSDSLYSNFNINSVLELFHVTNWVTPVTVGEILDKDYAPITKWFTPLDL